MMNKFKSSEDYLERIYILTKTNKTLRAIDLAQDMGYSKPSVSVALKKLKSNNFITVDEENGYIGLTDKGLELAAYVYEKHQIISTCLMMLGVSEITALEDACKIEHDLSDESFDALKAYYQKIKG